MRPYPFSKHPRRLIWPTRARHKGESACPDLWPDYAWVPSLGATGSNAKIFGDLSGGEIQSGGSWIAEGYYFNLSGEVRLTSSNIPTAIGSGNQHFTLFARYKSTYTSDNQNILTISDFSELDLYASINIDASTKHARAFYRNNIFAPAVGTTDVLDGKYHNLFTIVKGTSLIELYVDGLFEADDTTNQTVHSTTDLDVAAFGILGRSSQWATGPCKGTMALACIYLTDLNASQISQLHRDPYCWLRPKANYIFGYLEAGTDIISTLAILTLEDFLSSVNVEKNITSTLEQLSLVSYTSVVNAAKNIISTLEQLDLVSYLSTVQADVDTDVVSTLSTITLNDYLSQVQADIDTDVVSDLSTLNLTTYDSLVEVVLNVVSTLVTLDLLGYNSTVEALIDTDVSSNLIELLLETYETTINAADTRPTPDHRVLKVLNEIRTLVVKKENRILAIENEDRILKIKPNVNKYIS